MSCLQFFHVVNILALLLLLLCLHTTFGATYVWTPEDEFIFTDCPDNPRSVADLLDVTNFVYKRTEEGQVHIEGAAKVIWDVEPTDRITVQISGYRFERGFWQPTIFNGVAENLCERFYEKGQIWYDFWTKHITNNENNTNCLNLKGTLLKHEPFNIDVAVSGIHSLTLAGRYKFVVVFSAYDKNNVSRQNAVCMQIISEASKKPMM